MSRYQRRQQRKERLGKAVDVALGMAVLVVMVGFYVVDQGGTELEKLYYKWRGDPEKDAQ